MFYLKTPCGCITLADDNVDLTKPETMGLGHEIVVYGCSGSQETFFNPDMTTTPFPESVSSQCEKISLLSPEGMKITESVNELIQRGKQGTQGRRAMEFTTAIEEADGMRLLKGGVGADDDDDDENQDIPSEAKEFWGKLFGGNLPEGIQVFKIPVKSNPLADLLNSLTNDAIPVNQAKPAQSSHLSMLSALLGPDGRFPDFPSTGSLTIDEFVEVMGLERSLTPDEVMMFKGYMRTAQRLAAFPEPSPATDRVLTVLKEKCCNLMRKHLSGQLRELGQLGELRELRELTDLLRQLRR